MAWLINISVPLYKNDEVTPKFREYGIMSGYRFESSPLQCIVSVFHPTNETANFWTHFIPSLYFTWQLFTQICENPTDWHFLVYMMTVATYLWVSCIAHAFSCMSAKSMDICYFFDYLALSVFGYATALMYLSFSFPQDFSGSRFEMIYLIGCIISSTACTSSSCLSRTMTDNVTCKYVRVTAFVGHYIWVNVPLFYRLVWEGWKNDTVAMYYNSQFVAMGLAAFFYSTHIPERLAPGKFDYLGNSHNLLHICGVIGTELQRRAVLADIDVRKRNDIPPLISGQVTLAAITTDLIVNGTIVAIFIWQLNKIYKKYK